MFDQVDGALEKAYDSLDNLEKIIAKFENRILPDYF